MQRVVAALRQWRDAQAQALKAEVQLSKALDAELAGGAKTPQELVEKVKQLRALADARFGFAMTVMDKRDDLKL